MADKLLNIPDAPAILGLAFRAMVLKSKDPLDREIARIEQLLRSSVTPAERRNAEKDLARLRSGIKGEEEAAYHIDFYLKELPVGRQ